LKIFISIVSHLHHDVIINLGTIKRLRKYGEVHVVCRDNIPVSKLQVYCDKYDAVYLPNDQQQGFAANNNSNFLYCQEKLGMKNSDIFLLLNPDIYIGNDAIVKLIAKIKEQPPKLATCNLYLDREHMVQDDNIRIYPKLINFIKTYLLNDRSTMVNRESGLSVSKKYWASCSFMIVQADLYKQLKGLDESYYMYCEDIDFCYRANLVGQNFLYLESIKAVHYRRRDSKRFLSKYFFWHVGSVVKYSFYKKTLEAKKSCIPSDL
jgi:GT2 family glycosyltransferase